MHVNHSFLPVILCMFRWTICDQWTSYILLGGLKEYITMKLRHCTRFIYCSQSSTYKKHCKLYLGHCQEVMNEVTGGVTPVLFSWVWLALFHWFPNMQGFLPSIYGLIACTGLLKGFLVSWDKTVCKGMPSSASCVVLYVVNRNGRTVCVVCTHSLAHQLLQLTSALEQIRNLTFE